MIPLLAALGAVALVLAVSAAHGFISHGWGPRLVAWLYGDLTPAPTAHHARHLARLQKLRRTP